MASTATKLQSLRKFFGGHLCLPQNARQSADHDLSMHGNDAALVAAPQNDMTSALTNPHKTESLKRAHDFSARDTRKFRHARYAADQAWKEP